MRVSFARQLKGASLVFFLLLRLLLLLVNQAAS